MSAGISTCPAVDYGALRIPLAAFEVLGYLAVVAAAALAFLAGWLTLNAAVVITVLLLATLIVLSWIHLGHGRHPVFLFLCTLMLFQGGRLVAFCLGSISDPFEVSIMVDVPFGVSRSVAGMVLLCLSLSAISVYAPCRWNYHWLPPPADADVRRYLPYLYLVYFAGLPFLVYKNYLYYSYIRSHGGYIVFFSDYANLAANVPLVVRLMALLPLPVLVLIFVFEHRKKLLYTVVALYFCGSIVLLLTGTRQGTFALILTLWYVARIKSAKPARISRLVVLALALILVANVIADIRNEENVESQSAIDVVNFIATQGISLAVTEVAVMHRSLFLPYVPSYLLHEFEIDLVPSDVSTYFRGRQFGYDVSVYLNPQAFSSGLATSGAYVAEAYVIAGLFGVIAISLLIGGGLHLLYLGSRSARGLVWVAFAFPQVLLLPRAYLLGWGSSLLRSALLLLPIALGWALYCLMAGALKAPQAHRSYGSAE